MHLAGLAHIDLTIYIQAGALFLSQGKLVTHLSVFKSNPGPVSKVESAYFKKNNIQVDITYLSNEGRLDANHDYFFFENAIFQWYAKILDKHQDPPLVFIGGGNKIHSLILQKAAFHLGASEVFHMFYNGERGSEPKNLKEINSAISENLISLALMGRENGWPALKQIDFDNENLANHIRKISYSISRRTIDQTNEYPFEAINLLPGTAIDWLNNPLDEEDYDWILSLPKVELHCHLGGFATKGALLKSIRDCSVNILQPVQAIPYPANWPFPEENISLLDYMQLGDNNGSYILKDEGCLEAQVNYLYDHFMQQRIKYAEVRCSPYNYRTENKSGDEILGTIRAIFNRKMAENIHHPDFCHVNLILIATRKRDGDLFSIKNHIQQALKFASNSNKKGSCKIVAIDLAGFEHETTRASYFEQDFTPIHRAGIALTIHAGENDDSEGIWQAVFNLNTRRIGHGLHLYQDEKLINSVVNRQIGIEMCPFANYQIIGFAPMKGKNAYPLLDYLRKGTKVTVNTDNIGISSASLSDNILFLISLCPGITRMEVLQLLRNGFDQAFIDYSLRNELLKDANKVIFKNIFYKE